jgi:hypothetical protein
MQTVKTTLKSIDGNGVTLEESETLELDGKTIEKSPLNVKYDFFHVPVQENVRISQGTPTKLEINKKFVPCAVRIYEQQTAGGRLTTTIWYSPQVYPYVLRTETVLRSVPDGENAGGQIVRSSVTLVQETSALKTIRGNRRSKTYALQTEEKAGNITKITNSRCSWDVPGGLMESTTREFDAQNREIRYSVSQMKNYYSYGSTFLLSAHHRLWTLVAMEY